MKKKHSLTLLEVIVAMVLLGILLTGLFQCFQQGLKKNIAAKELKQRVLQLELFQQHLKHLFTLQDEVWIKKHQDAVGNVLMLSYEQKLDPDFQMCGALMGMLYLNKNKELCFATWSEQGKDRIEILLDKVDAFKCQLFDPKAAQFSENWPLKKEEIPRMVSIRITWSNKEIPFVFFINSIDEKISYSGSS